MQTLPPHSGSVDVVLANIERRLSATSGAGIILDALLHVKSIPGFGRIARTGGILMQAGLVEDAEALYVAAAASFSGNPGSLAGLAQAAMRRKDWATALKLWDEALTIAKDAANSLWLSVRAMVLFELGRLHEAEDILASLLVKFPEQPTGIAGLAQLAMRKRDFSAALERCDELLNAFGAHPAAADWQVLRAAALWELGRGEEAEAMAREVSGANPILLSALLLLVRIEAASGRADAAWKTLSGGPFAEIMTPALADQRLDVLNRLQRREDARALHANLVERASTPEMLESVFASVPRLYGVEERPPVLTRLLARSKAIQGQLERGDAGGLLLLNSRIQLASRDWKGAAESVGLAVRAAGEGEHREMLVRVASVLSDPRYPDFGKPKVFGIGLSRTGTTTLASALTVLGLNTLHWSNPLTGEVICDDDFAIFDAFTDTPVTVKFEGLCERFPNSKFILTVRPFDAWVRSMTALWRRSLGVSEFEELKAALAGPDAVRYGTEFCSINRQLYFDHRDYREAYDAHERRVRRFFSDKPGRFLELNIFAGDGWEKLCAFLGVEVPSAPFPWENRSPARAVQIGPGAA